MAVNIIHINSQKGSCKKLNIFLNSRMPPSLRESKHRHISLLRRETVLGNFFVFFQLLMQ